MKKIILFLALIAGVFSYGQKGKTYFGLQFKPIIPNKYVGQFEQNYSFDSVPKYNGTIKQQPGYVFGIAVRHGLSKSISFETGINYTRRTYNISYASLDSGFVLNNNVSIINYDIPLNGLIYIQLSDAWFMNASAGINLSFYPTHVFTQAPLIDVNNQFYQVGTRNGWIQTGVNANYGFEYRSKNSGIIYLGASYSQPFAPIMNFIMTWRNYNVRYKVYEKIDGSYLTLDLKYFIP